MPIGSRAVNARVHEGRLRSLVCVRVFLVRVSFRLRERVKVGSARHHSAAPLSARAFAFTGNIRTRSPGGERKGSHRGAFSSTPARRCVVFLAPEDWVPHHRPHLRAIF